MASAVIARVSRSREREELIDDALDDASCGTGSPPTTAETMAGSLDDKQLRPHRDQASRSLQVMRCPERIRRAVREERRRAEPGEVGRAELGRAAWRMQRV